jgi:predicted  nucleic acid-binding Zn-ribbon protein
MDASKVALIVISQPEILFQLQDIDLTVLRSRQRIQAIDQLLANDEAIRSAQNRLTEAQNTLTPLRARARNLEHEIQANESKSQTSEQQLYSGAIKNTKEMQDMQQEIESLKKWHSELETQLLETMMSVEAAEAALAEAESALAAITTSRGDEHRQLLDERQDLQTRVQQLRQRREQVLKDILPANLQLYDKLRPRKHNQPVALMEGNTCGICGVAQTVAIERAVRQGTTITHCSNCDRILVYKN